MNSNDTLNGQLFQWETDDEKHLRHQFGYWRMVEERMIRADLEAQGIAPTYFTIQAKVQENHANDVPYKATSANVVKSIQLSSTDSQKAIDALRKIAEGCNDARRLAMEVLAMINVDGKRT